MQSKRKLGVIIPCHNDAIYLKRCLSAIMQNKPYRVFVIIDRCNDNSLEVAKQFNVEIYVKSSTKWRNSIAENLNIGFIRLIDCDYIATIAADTVIASNYFDECIRAMEEDDEIVSVAGKMLDEPSSLFNKLHMYYELALERIGLEHSIRASGRVYRASKIREIYRKNGQVVFDVLAEDLLLDQMLDGKRKIIDKFNLCIRRTGIKKSISGQIRSGIARRELGKGPEKLMGEILRLRFFVIIGYLVCPLILRF